MNAYSVLSLVQALMHLGMTLYLMREQCGIWECPSLQAHRVCF